MICKKDVEIDYELDLSRELLLDDCIISLLSETILFIHEKELNKITEFFEDLYKDYKYKTLKLYEFRKMIDDTNRDINYTYANSIDLIDNFKSESDVKDMNKCHKCELCVPECMKIEELYLCKNCIMFLYYDYLID